MNLELLDPFRRQIPDRVDATLHLPANLHFQKKDMDNKENKTSDTSWKVANLSIFNRRGSYVAVGYASGSVAVFDILSRTLSSLYRAEKINAADKYGHESNPSDGVGHGITCLSWSRHSRTLLAGSLGSRAVTLIDNTHPAGPEECCTGVKITEKEADDDQRSQSPTVFTPQKSKSSSSETSFAARPDYDRHFKTAHTLQTRIVDAKKEMEIKQRGQLKQRVLQPASLSVARRYPSIRFKFPLAIGTSLQVHPKDSLAGQAVLADGSLVVFSVPRVAFEESIQEKDNQPQTVLISTVFSSEKYEITCSTFDPHGGRIYAATRDGKLLGFDVAALFDQLSKESDDIPFLQPSFVIPIPGGASVWHIVVSRNARYIVINSADAAIRLYEAKECWTTPEGVEKPVFVFQDVVQKVKFASCDISGDGEYVAGGAQGNDTKYEVYIWNTSTGVLVDKLTGAPVDLYSVSWHPTRSFLAVAASDGLVDVWGPRINWTAFAPDFQALPGNVEYVECEDEFDFVDVERGNNTQRINEGEDDEKANIDILTLHKIPVFQSDSEDEAEVFHFDVVKRPVGSNSLS